MKRGVVIAEMGNTNAAILVSFKKIIIYFDNFRFLGDMCQQSVCLNNPCQYGATCVAYTGSGYLCLCPFGKHGHFCENGNLRTFICNL